MCYVNTLKAAPCMDCDKTFPTEAMDWDHRPGTVKTYNIGELVSGRYSFDKVLTEISKCDLVCSNCHRTRLKNRLNENDSFPPFIPFPKIPRWNREIIVTEKIDGCNAKILISGTGDIFAGGRNRWLRPKISTTRGIVIYHTAGKHHFKITCENDEQPKGLSNDN